MEPCWFSRQQSFLDASLPCVRKDVSVPGEPLRQSRARNDGRRAAGLLRRRPATGRFIEATCLAAEERKRVASARARWPPALAPNSDVESTCSRATRQESSDKPCLLSTGEFLKGERAMTELVT